MSGIDFSLCSGQQPQTKVRATQAQTEVYVPQAQTKVYAAHAIPTAVGHWRERVQQFGKLTKTT